MGWDTRSGNSVIASQFEQVMFVSRIQRRQRRVHTSVSTAETKACSRCCPHNCLALSSHPSAALKILHKGGPPAPTSSVGGPPARSEVRLLLILPRTAEGKEVPSSGGEYVGRKHAPEREHSLRPLHTTAETTQTHTLAHTHRNEAHVKPLVPSRARTWCGLR